MIVGLVVLLVLRSSVRLNAAPPVPERITDCGLPVALSLMVRAEERVPLAVGVKVTLMVHGGAWGASTPLFGALRQLSVSAKSVLPVLILVRFNGSEPVLVTVTV